MKKSFYFKILLAVVVLLIFVHYLKIILPLENQLLSNLSAAQQFLYQQSNKLNSFLYFIINFKKLLKENNDLKNQLSQWQIDQLQLDIFRAENENLKNQLNYLKGVNYQYQTAKIIGQSTLDSQILILDKGLADGLQENLVVIYQNGIVVGKINEVKEKISYLRLITDNQSLIAAKTVNQSMTIGLVKGQLGINCLMTLIPQEAEINVNDLIITSGLEENIPSGLLIGQIKEIKSSSQLLFKEAVINPLFTLGQLDYLIIIIPTNE